MKERLKNKTLLGVLAVLVYQVLVHFDIAPKLETYQMVVDVICYIVIGYGVYSTFPSKDEGNEG